MSHNIQRIFSFAQTNDSLDLSTLEEDGLALQFFDSSAISLEACLTAVKQNGLAVRFVHASLRTKEGSPMRNSDVLLQAARQNGLSLQYMDEDEITDEIDFAALRQNGLAIQFIRGKRRTPAKCLASVRQNGNALQFIIEPHLRSEEVCVAAAMQEGMSIQSLSDEQKTNQVCISAARQNGASLRMMSRAKRTSEVRKAALEQDGWAIQFFDHDNAQEKPTEDEKLIAVQQSGYAIRFIEGRSAAVCLAAAKRSFPCVKSFTLQDFIQEGSDDLQCLISANWAEFVHIVGRSRAKEVANAIAASCKQSNHYPSSNILHALPSLTLNELGVLPGLILQTRKHTTGTMKKNLQFIGAMNGKGILVAPTKSDQGAFVLAAGETCVIQGFTGRYEFSFLGTVLQTFEKPYVYALIEYPRRIDSVMVRQSLRVQASWPAVLSALDNSNETHDAMMEDLSIQGAKIRTSFKPSENSKMCLTINAALDDETLKVQVNCSVRYISKIEDEEAYHLGLVFDNISQPEKMAINYLCTK